MESLNNTLLDTKNENKHTCCKIICFLFCGCAGTYYLNEPTPRSYYHTYYHSYPYPFYYHTNTIVIKPYNKPNKPNKPNRPNKPNTKPKNKKR